MVLASPSATIMLYFKSVAHSKIMKSYTYYLSWFRFGHVCVCVNLRLIFLIFVVVFFPTDHLSCIAVDKFHLWENLTMFLFFLMICQKKMCCSKSTCHLSNLSNTLFVAGNLWGTLTNIAQCPIFFFFTFSLCVKQSLTHANTHIFLYSSGNIWFVFGLSITVFGFLKGLSMIMFIRALTDSYTCGDLAHAFVCVCVSDSLQHTCILVWWFTSWIWLWVVWRNCLTVPSISTDIATLNIQMTSEAEINVYSLLSVLI